MVALLLAGAVAVMAAGGMAQTSTTFSTKTTTSGATTSMTTSQTTSATTTTSIVTHTVAVGAEGFKFTPAQVNASVGDIIEWEFYPTNHAVVQAAFGYPCIPYDLTGPSRTGFFSGFQQVNVVSDDGPRFRVRINDTNPVFYYCAAAGSCIQQHMIGVINPSANETFDMQLQYVLNSTFQLAPGQPWPSEGTASESPVPTAVYTGQDSDGSNNNTSSSSSGGNGISAGQIAGIAVGAAAVLVLAGALIYLCGRRGGLDKSYRQASNQFPAPAVVEAKYGPHSPGQETFSSATVAASGYGEPPRHNSTSPGAASDHQHPAGSHVSAVTSGYPTHNQPTPPMPVSPRTFDSSHMSYGSAGPYQQSMHGTMMAGVSNPDGTYSTQGPYSPPLPPQPQTPVELPSSEDPGNSPLPGYPNQRHMSWARGEEAAYRPSTKH